MRNIKLSFLILLCFTALSAGINIKLDKLKEPSKPVPPNIIRQIAQWRIANKYVVNSFDEPIPLADPNDRVIAYLFTFSFNDDKFPPQEKLFQDIYQAPRNLWKAGEYGYIIVSSSYASTPIYDIADCLPPFYATSNKALATAKGKLACKAEPKLVNIYFLSPASIWFKFRAEDDSILVNGYLPSNTAAWEGWTTVKKNWQYSPKTSKGWDNISAGFKRYHFKTITEGYVEDVPTYLWSYGCAPTSSAMVLGYWNEWGYGAFIDYYFDHYDAVLHSTVSDVPNVQKELAIAMNTDTSNSGGTYPSDMPKAHIYVTDTLNGYSFGSQMSPEGCSANNYNWDWIISEIGLGRPFVWGVLDFWYDAGCPCRSRFINHATTGVGYEIDGVGDSMVIIKNTWDYGEHSWPLHTSQEGTESRSRVISIEPGGGTGASIDLLTPEGGDNFAHGDLMQITWDTSGSTINYVALEYTDDNCQTWQEITDSTTSTGPYEWTVPEETTSVIIKIRIKAYDSTGTFLCGAPSGNIIILSAQNITCSGYCPVGHVESDHDDIMVMDSFAYVADGLDGVGEINVANPNQPYETARFYDTKGPVRGLWVKDSLVFIVAEDSGGLQIISRAMPDTLVKIGEYPNISKPYDVEVQGDYAYVLDNFMGLYVFDVSDPTNPTRISSWINYAPGAYKGLEVVENYVYIAKFWEGIVILDVSDIENIAEAGSYDTDGLAEDIFFLDDKLFVADGTTGLTLLDVSTRTAPELLGTFDTEGYGLKVTAHKNFAYIADLTKGLKILDYSNPSAIQRVGYFETRGTALAVAVKSPTAYLTARYDGLYILNFDDLVGIKSPGGHNNYNTNILKIFPNPFHSKTTISVNLGEIKSQLPSNIALTVYNTLGHQVDDLSAKLAANLNKAGEAHIAWPTDNSATALQPGIYIIEFKCDSIKKFKKIVLVK